MGLESSVLSGSSSNVLAGSWLHRRLPGDEGTSGAGRGQYLATPLSVIFLSVSCLTSLSRFPATSFHASLCCLPACLSLSVSSSFCRLPVNILPLLSKSSSCSSSSVCFSVLSCTSLDCREGSKGVSRRCRGNVW